MSETIVELNPIQCKYIATYIQRLDHELKKIKDIKDLDNLPTHLGLNYVQKDKPLDILKLVCYKAMERQHLICDFADSKHPETSKGRCQDENHYEELEEPIVPLNESQQKEYDLLCETEGVYHAQKKFEDNFNPDNQELQLVLGLEEEDQKLNDNEPTYICERCMEILKDNADGIVACDMDDAE